MATRRGLVELDPLVADLHGDEDGDYRIWILNRKTMKLHRRFNIGAKFQITEDALHWFRFTVGFWVWLQNNFQTFFHFRIRLIDYHTPFIAVMVSCNSNNLCKSRLFTEDLVVSSDLDVIDENPPPQRHDLDVLPVVPVLPVMPPSVWTVVDVAPVPPMETAVHLGGVNLSYPDAIGLIDYHTPSTAIRISDEKCLVVFGLMRRLSLSLLIHSYDSLLASLVKDKKLGVALCLYCAMVRNGVQSSELTWDLVDKTFCKGGISRNVVRLAETGVVESCKIYSNLVECYSRNGEFDVVFKVSHEMDEQKLQLSFSSYSCILDDVCRLGDYEGISVSTADEIPFMGVADHTVPTLDSLRNVSVSASPQKLAMVISLMGHSTHPVTEEAFLDGKEFLDFSGLEEDNMEHEAGLQSAQVEGMGPVQGLTTQVGARPKKKLHKALMMLKRENSKKRNVHAFTPRKKIIPKSSHHSGHDENRSQTGGEDGPNGGHLVPKSNS